MPSQTTTHFIRIIIVIFSCAVHTAIAQPINEEYKITPVNGTPMDGFGFSMAIEDGIMAIGAPFNQQQGSNPGAVYLYDVKTGSQLRKITGITIGSGFGYSIDIHNGLLAVGAPFDDAGAAYVFDIKTGDQLSAFAGENSVDRFGQSVAIDNGILAVGAPRAFNNTSSNRSGAAYLFNVETEQQITKIEHDFLPSGGLDKFGTAIDIHNNLVVIGAPDYFRINFEVGVAYIYDAQTKTTVNRITAPNPSNLSFLHFGSSVAINDGLIAVGAPQGATLGFESGAAYLYNASDRSFIGELIPEDGFDEHNFGHSIALSKNRVAVGAVGDFSSEWRAGSAYLFDASSRDQIAKLVASDTAAYQYVGASVAINDHYVAAGSTAPSGFSSPDGFDSRSAYVFNISKNPACPADYSSDGLLDIDDINAFLAAYSAADASADFNEDAQVDFFDFSAFLISYNAGCQ